ncbi:ribonuclease P protein subunit p38 [Tachyglossus aculeatus]|uniref:ribonuclease P protein subunit p38 n=1 Tax=Tachyglossus aculeatus TaxID=9261 RepID=UPI0018F3097A|nr:ribonuclease P protein subunit p38 [Tachyglossus aculeatus]
MDAPGTKLAGGGRGEKTAPLVGTGGVRKAKPLAVKTSLGNPYAVTWSPLSGEAARFILRTLEAGLKAVGLRKAEQPKGRRRPPSRAGRASGGEPVRPAPAEAPRANGWTPSGVREQLAIGVNEVTRALERDRLALVLTCRSVEPAPVTSHLIHLSVSRAVPACQLPGLSQTVAPVLGLKCVLALGFRRDAASFARDVEAIVPRIPRLRVPWLPGPGAGSESDSREAPGDEEAAAAAADASLGGPTKRKREGGPRGHPRLTLQPLKIKKLIPNPDKRRKPPKGKKGTKK